MRPSVLFVEDEEALRMTVGDRLRSEGYIVDCAADGDEGLEKATQLPFDLIILDLMLPDRDGLSICHDLRQAGLITPLLMLTARGQTEDKILGLKTGADDYVTKPFNMQELVARIEALLRRAPTGSPAHRGVYQFATIRVDRRATEVTRDGKPVNLSVREFQLLKYLIEHAGVTRLARTAADRRLGLQRQDLHAHRRCAHRQPAPEAGERSEAADLHPDGPARRLQVHARGRDLVRNPLGERALATLLVVPTAIAVIMLAIVQYRWSEEVRSATSVRLADSLQMSMMSWHLNLFRDLSDICLRVRLDSDRLGGHELEQTRATVPRAAGVGRIPRRRVRAPSGVGRTARCPACGGTRRHTDSTRSRDVPGLEALRDELSRAVTAALRLRHRASGDSSALSYTSGDLRDWRFEPNLPACFGRFRPTGSCSTASRRRGARWPRGS